MSFHKSREVCELHVANLIDMIAASISVIPSEDTLIKVKTLTGLIEEDRCIAI